VDLQAGIDRGIDRGFASKHSPWICKFIGKLKDLARNHTKGLFPSPENLIVVHGRKGKTLPSKRLHG
jgi:hypothetical protein